MIIWLVVYLPLWKIWKSGKNIPNIRKNKIHVPNHQPVIHELFMIPWEIFAAKLAVNDQTLSHCGISWYIYILYQIIRNISFIYIYIPCIGLYITFITVYPYLHRVNCDPQMVTWAMVKSLQETGRNHTETQVALPTTWYRMPSAATTESPCSQV